MFVSISTKDVAQVDPAEIAQILDAAGFFVQEVNVNSGQRIYPGDGESTGTWALEQAATTVRAADVEVGQSIRELGDDDFQGVSAKDDAGDVVVLTLVERGELGTRSTVMLHPDTLVEALVQ